MRKLTKIIATLTIVFMGCVSASAMEASPSWGPWRIVQMPTLETEGMAARWDFTNDECQTIILAPLEDITRNRAQASSCNLEK